MEDSPSSSSFSNLLPKSKSKPKPTNFFFFIFIVIVVFSLTNLPHSPSQEPKLPHQSLILISFDGFRFGYQFKTPTPNIHRLVLNGTSADLGLIPVYPTLTFPNHYSIATGLYPARHGIVNNRFFDPDTGEEFTITHLQPRWWLGEPIWETVTNHGFNAATYFWAGSEVKKGSWTCPTKFCPKYNQSVPFEDRIDAVLGYFDLPVDEIPIFTAVYFSDPDSQGHKFGPDHPEIGKAVGHLDLMIGRLIDGLEKRGIFEEITIILVGDHGMVGVCEEKYVYLEDLRPWIEIPSSWVQSRYQLLAIRPPTNVSVPEVVDKMNEGLRSGKVGNGDKLRVYLKGDLPERLHYLGSDRICPIIGMVEEGYMVEVTRSEGSICGGEHGYDNDLFSMRSIFVGHGPRFERGRKIASFENIEIYNLMTSILKLKGAPNDGSDSFANHVLLPST